MDLVNLFKKEGEGENKPSPSSEELPIVEVTRQDEIRDHLEELMQGRLESDIPLGDDYWKLKAQYQQELHRLNGDI